VGPRAGLDVVVLELEPLIIQPIAQSYTTELSQLHKTTNTIINLYILIFRFLEKKREDKNSGQNDRKHPRNLICFLLNLNPHLFLSRWNTIQILVTHSLSDLRQSLSQ
jgi:hypothetical protein